MKNWFRDATKDEESTSKFLGKLLVMAVLSIVIVILIALLPHLLSWFFGAFSALKPSFIGTAKLEEYGVFGDFIGGVLNPILTFISFMALIVTIILQQRELSEARKEFKRTANALEKENVESTFFKLLDRIPSALSNVSYHGEKGRNSLFKLKYYASSPITTLDGTVIREWQEVWKKRGIQPAIYNYMSTIYSAANVSVSADASIASPTEKNFYTELLKDQLTPEDIWIFYYFLRFNKSEEELKILIPKFSVIWLKMDMNTLLESRDKEPYYLYLA